MVNIASLEVCWARAAGESIARIAAACFVKCLHPPRRSHGSVRTTGSRGGRNRADNSTKLKKQCAQSVLDKSIDRISLDQDSWGNGPARARTVRSGI
jgi:hypothetical protein